MKKAIALLAILAALTLTGCERQVEYDDDDDRRVVQQDERDDDRFEDDDDD